MFSHTFTPLKAHERDFMSHYSSLTILTVIASFVTDSSSLTLLAHSIHLLMRNMQSDFLWIYKNKVVVFTPSSVGEIWRRCFASLAANANSSAQ